MYKNDVEFHVKIDLREIKDSMQLDSEQTIATLKMENKTASLEVRGDVKVFWNPDKDEDPGDGECYTQPSEFSQELKDIIAGKKTIYRKDGDTEGIENMWTLDDRVYVSENNWFELFVTNDENDTFPISDVVDVEGYNATQIFELMYGALAEGGEC